MNQYIPVIVDKFTGVIGKGLNFIPGLTPDEVGEGYDLAIKALQDSKAAYLANPKEAVAPTIEDMVDDSLQGVVGILDAEGQTQWAGYVQEADNLLQYVTTHPAITKFILSLGNIFKKKAVAATTPA